MLEGLIGQQNIPLEMVRYKEKPCPKKDLQKVRGTAALGHLKKLKVSFGAKYREMRGAPDICTVLDPVKNNCIKRLVMLAVLT